MLAVLDTAGGVGAVGDSGLEGINVPAVDEITVISVAWQELVTFRFSFNRLNSPVGSPLDQTN